MTRHDVPTTYLCNHFMSLDRVTDSVSRPSPAHLILDPAGRTTKVHCLPGVCKFSVLWIPCTRLPINQPYNSDLIPFTLHLDHNISCVHVS
jgi:hypothetical protein